MKPTDSFPQNIGKALMRIRHERRIRQCDLAKNLGIPPSQLCKLEKGSSAPSLNTFIRIANELGVSITDLLSLCLQSNTTSISTSEKFNRRISATNPLETIVCTADGIEEKLPLKVLKAIRKQINEYKQLEAMSGICRHATIPLKLPFSLREEDAEALAQRVRNLCGIGNAIAFDYVELLEDNGFHIFTLKDLPTSLPSISFYDTVDNNTFIFIAKQITPEKQLFRLIYELAFIYLYTRLENQPVPQTYEYKHFANIFAANFLMPRGAVLGAISRFNLLPTQWTFELLERVKLRFSVSAEAFTIRLIELGALDRNLGQDILTQIRSYYAANNNCEPYGSRINVISNTRIDDMKMILSAKRGEK